VTVNTKHPAQWAFLAGDKNFSTVGTGYGDGEVLDRARTLFGDGRCGGVVGLIEEAVVFADHVAGRAKKIIVAAQERRVGEKIQGLGSESIPTGVESDARSPVCIAVRGARQLLCCTVEGIEDQGYAGAVRAVGVPGNSGNIRGCNTQDSFV